ncbi:MULTISPECIES: SDR family oxidoreductase [unclassified Iodidimonas]|jgi:NAD(P)-dependent dehydrogenase (short-subunit alcohol dehydrogenase family)|uniref:SDR family oxidoreductase n=1 Tax=unclassified Iodidimonas TaxID=2626145 RepID=UPI0024821AC7|nr:MULTISPECIES: SDR family oxidoreductase [unclassified Iodidimonas]
MSIDPIKKAILITGAAQRIGRAMALDLGKAGYPIAVHYHRSAQDADETVDAIRAAGGRAHALCANLEDEDDLARLWPRAIERFGLIGGLINNASIFLKDDLDSTTRETWTRHMQINLRAPFVLIQAMAAHLGQQSGEDASGSIINIIDHRVWKLNPHFTSYTLSKSALWTLTQTAAQALAPHIRVNAIGPGPVLPSIHQNAEIFENEASATPLGHGPKLEEFGQTVRFLLETPSITGQMIALDGGQHLAWRTPDVDAGTGE